MVLRELRVRDLGVIDELSLVLDGGMTALTGETGAGKTLLVGAIDLLLGGRADPVMVRPGAAEAVIEGRFDEVPVPPSDEAGAPGVGDGVGEVVLSRVVSAAGRSRAYVGGRMATVAALAEAGRAMVDLHGQHAHQALFSAAAQRAALDQAGAVDLQPLVAARRAVAELEGQLAALGGDERVRAREIDLLRFQLQELDGAGLEDPGEDSALAGEEERLANAGALRDAATSAHASILGEGGALDQVGSALAALAGRPPLAGLEARLRAAQADLADVGSEARAAAEELEDDPARFEAVAARRQLLKDLCRKYGDSLQEVIAYRDDARARLADLEGWEARARALEAAKERAVDQAQAAAAAIGAARRAAAPALGAAVEAELQGLAMPRARFSVQVGDDPGGESVSWLLAANPGEAALPLAKVASGGELARTMLALRLVLGDLHSSRDREAAHARGPATGRTLVFDEVDAGIGGEAAVAVGRALAALARHHQVLVVTHLPQVAAFADHHVSVTKETSAGRTRTRAGVLDDSERVVELSRMLSGSPKSATAREHASELLAAARADR